MIAHNPLQAVTDRNKELIAGHVPEAVVDALEAVHVNEDQGVGLAVGPRLPERLIEPLHQQPPVGQAGQAVVERVLMQLVLERLALGDVAERDHRAGRHAVADDGCRGVRDRDGDAVPVPEAGVVLPDRPAGAHRLPSGTEQVVGRGGRQRGGGLGVVLRRVAGGRDVHRGQPDQVGGRGVDERQPAGGVHRADALAHAQGDRGEPLALHADLLVELGVAQRPVADGGQCLQQVALGVLDRLIPPPAGDHEPLLLAGHRHGRRQLARSRVGSCQRSLGAAEQLAHRVQDRVEHGLLAQPAVGLLRDLVQPLDPRAVVQRGVSGADELAHEHETGDGERQRPQVCLYREREDDAHQGGRARELHLKRQVSGEVTPAGAHGDHDAVDEERVDGEVDRDARGDGGDLLGSEFR